MRNVLHIIASILMWCLFGYYWYVVGRRSIQPQTVVALCVLMAIGLLIFVVTMLWVRHNLRLAEKFDRRREFSVPQETFVADWLGRPLVAPPLAELRAARVVAVELDDTERKVYRIAGEEVT